MIACVSYTIGISCRIIFLISFAGFAGNGEGKFNILIICAQQLESSGNDLSFWNNRVYHDRTEDVIIFAQDPGTYDRLWDIALGRWSVTEEWFCQY